MWAKNNRIYRQKNLEKEMLLASKVDQTDYNNFIKKKIENKEKHNLRNKAYNANKKLLKQNNIIVIDDNKNNNNNEINTKIIENVENFNMVPKTVKKIPKKSFSITNSSEIQNNITNLIDTPSKKFSKKKELLYTSALSPTILSLQSNKNLIDTNSKKKLTKIKNLTVFSIMQLIILILKIILIITLLIMIY